MEAWEIRAATLINVTRSLVRGEQNRLYRELGKTPGRDYREAELEDILEQLTTVKGHIDPHGEVPWDYQTPLPF